MGKSELDEKAEFERAVGLDSSVRSDHFFAVLFKILGFLVCIPLIMGLSLGFAYQLVAQKRSVVDAFGGGVLTYVLVHIFVIKFSMLRKISQQAIGAMFGFFTPLKRLLSLAVPFYTVLFFLMYCILKYLVKYDIVLEHIVFLLSFGSIMHLVHVAMTLEENTDSVRANYFFCLGLVFIAVLLILGACFNGVLKSFSIADVMQYGYQFFIRTYSAIWHQLFVLR